MADDALLSYMPFPPAMSRVRHYDITLRDYVDHFRIGVWGSEKGRRQPVRINLCVTVPWPDPPATDELDDVLSYDYLIDGIRRLRDGEHVQLVETLARRILTLCFSDPRVTRARVQVEKLEVVPESAGMGVVVEWSRGEVP
ncbi:dihydroneopterin aldolase [Azospirillum sp. RWY-5-1]|uniref:dihydroneopterin aldolase n=1 Tax=Azospirillum oleiclasticum TaxID=2735135 RepID=A0ABX2TFQ6_9PROT|nr:dihydroneopterin aldolase [Azospirillum oleiclasticum]NYZ23156.1 dihydroneopterin aldolase [Azospirillum oleiclasticum]